MLSATQTVPASGNYNPALIATIQSQVTSPPRLLDSLVDAATIIEFDRDDEIIFQGEDAEYCFEVISGCIRTVRLLEDGRRQVGEFLFAGDVLGCETAQQHEFGAEAVTACVLRRYRITAIEQRAASDIAFARRLLRHSAAQVRAARGRLVLLGRKTASERIASFLLEMQARLRPAARGTLDLPMARGDIADYLGLTIETVCRGLADLRHRGIVAVERTRIAIQDQRGLLQAGSDQLH